MLTAITIILGLVIGSFLSVCIYRIPLNRTERYDDEGNPLPEANAASADIVANPEKKPISIAYPPRSFCPHCNAQLMWWHNIPVVSWAILRGRCAFCKAKISARYPCVEIMSAAAAYGAYAIYGATPTAALVYVFAAALIVISFIDYDHYIIPNVISLPGTVIGLCIALLNHLYPIFTFPVVATIWDGLFGILAGAGFLLFISEVYLRLRKKEGLGMGDVKLLAMVGAIFGPHAAIYTIFIGSLLGSVIGIALIVILRRRMSHPLPFGPYLATATLLYLYGQHDLMITLGTGVAYLISGG